jgi:hypothetical protein
MKTSEQINELATALSAFQAEVPTVVFDANNPFFKSKYATLPAIVEGSKTLLGKHGLSVSQHPDGQYGLTTILLHKSGQYIQSTMKFPDELEVQKGMSYAQFAGSVISYQRRYAYASILGLVTDEDVDGNTPNQQDGKKPITPPQPAPELHPDILRKLNTVGSKLYGEGWDNKRKELVQAVTKGDATSAKQLTADEATRMIAGIEKKIADEQAKEKQVADIFGLEVEK